jgi:hypothetical protein
MVNSNLKIDDAVNIQIKLTALSSGDFIIAIKNKKLKTITIFINDRQVCELKDIEFDQYFYGIEDGVLKKIYIVKKDLCGLVLSSPKKDDKDLERDKENEDDDYDDEDSSNNRKRLRSRMRDRSRDDDDLDDDYSGDFDDFADDSSWDRF